MSQIFLPPHQAWTFARLPAVLAAHDIDPRGVTHIGAHRGEEVDIYRQCGFTCIHLVEPDPRNLHVLRDAFGDATDIAIIAAAVTSDPWHGTAALHLAERTVWSGLTPHPTATGTWVIVDTVPIATLLDDGETNVVVLDTQGSELDLLRVIDLHPLDLVIVETTRRPGDNAAFYDDAVSHMHAQGWAVTEEWVHDGSGYTDTVFTPR